MEMKLLVGKPGIGKTYTAEQYALDNDLHLVEYNASDERTAGSLKDLTSGQSIAVSGKKIMYLFDEVDNMEKGGAKKLAEFLSYNKSMTIFLTANNLNKVSKEIQKECEIVFMNSKSQKEIVDILKLIFVNQLDFEPDAFEALAIDSAKRSNGDLRKAQQLMLYQNVSKYDTVKLDSLKAIKMILYEKDRRAVYDYIRGIPISSLYSWLFETFAVNHDKEATKMMQEINKNLYKLNEVYLYSFIAYELPVKTSKLVERLPTSNKIQKLDEGIVEKLEEHFKCGRNEALQYLNLLKSIAEDKYCKENVADNCHLTKMEREHLGITVQMIEKKEKKVVVTNSLLNY